MFPIDFANPWDLLLLCVQAALVFLLLRAFTLRAQVSEFDDLAFINLTVTFSIVTISRMAETGFFPERGIQEVFPLIFLFYAGIATTARFSNFEKNKAAAAQNLHRLINQDSASNFILLAALVLYALFGGWFSFMQLRADAPDARLVIADNNRIFDIFRTGSMFIFINLLFIRTLVKPARMLWIMFSIFIIIAFSSGSKSIVLVLASNYMLLRGVLRGRNIKQDLKLFIPVAFLGIGMAFLIIKFYIGDTQIAFEKTVSRVVLAGDIYIYSYTLNDYRDYFDTYNPILYFFHPFLRLVGSAGYERPFGNTLFLDTFGEDVFGPNPHFTMLALLFSHGKMIIAGLLCFMGGCTMVCLKNIALLTLGCSHFYPPIWKIIVFTALFPCASLFLDIGLYQQNLITVGLVSMALLFCYEFLRGQYVHTPAASSKPHPSVPMKDFYAE
jgi:hypothetical protein